eukprot:gb/GECG01013310.1/.p1 GENE.gb/GECG01013310.1/~~gb/GECG01013310.1/.p1  ORF type:complete len:312 (+),score=49.01 gb/GECG01013310.1/:1-936(+)
MPGSEHKRSSEGRSSSKSKRSKSHKKKRHSGTNAMETAPVSTELGAEGFLEPSAFGENVDSAILGVPSYSMDDPASLHEQGGIDVEHEQPASKRAKPEQPNENLYQSFQLAVDDNMMEEPYFAPPQSREYSSGSAAASTQENITTDAASSDRKRTTISAEGKAKRRDKNRSGTACRPCEIGKRKCDGGRPCDRCLRIGKKDVCVDGKAATKKKSKGVESKRKNRRRSSSENDSRYHQQYPYHPPVSEYGAIGSQEAYMDNLPASFQQSYNEGQTPPLSVNFADHIDSLGPGGHNDFRQGDPRSYMGVNSKF